MDFGNKLQNLRKNKNMSQEQLADKLGVSRQAVSKWESNASYPEMDKIISICKLFDCSIDELLNTKSKSNEISNKAIHTLNLVLNFISKSINMFLAMTFKQKIKCIFEMLIIVVMLLCIFSLFRFTLYQLFRNVSNILPREIYIAILSLGKLIYNLFAIILSIIIFIHLFKTRYLNYYTIIDKNEENSELINSCVNNIKNEEKIIIRDPKDSSISIIKFIKKCFNIMLKFISIILIFFGSMSFVFIFGMLTIIAWYIASGPIFIGGFILALGMLLLNYIILNVLYKFIVNKKQSIKTIFIICIISLSFVGIGIGISWYSYSKFETKTIEYNYIIKSKMIDFNNNLSIEPNTNYVVDNTLEDKIKIEIRYIDRFNVNLSAEHNYTNIDNSDHYYDYYFAYVKNNDFMSEFNYFIEILKNKQIPNFEDSTIKIYYLTLYSSEENINTIKENNLSRLNISK